MHQFLATFVFVHYNSHGFSLMGSFVWNLSRLDWVLLYPFIIKFSLLLEPQSVFICSWSCECWSWSWSSRCWSLNVESWYGTGDTDIIEVIRWVLSPSLLTDDLTTIMYRWREGVVYDIDIIQVILIFYIWHWYYTGDTDIMQVILILYRWYWYPTDDTDIVRVILMSYGWYWYRDDTDVLQVRWRRCCCSCCVVFSIFMTTGSSTVISKHPIFSSATRASLRSCHLLVYKSVKTRLHAAMCLDLIRGKGKGTEALGPSGKGKGKGQVLDIALLCDEHMPRSALQSRKWQLIGMS